MRLSTVGSEVLDGIGLGVSVRVGVGVGVTEAVGEAVGAGSVTVVVKVTNAGSVGRLVSTKVVGIGVDVSVQANEERIHRIEKIRFRLMANQVLLWNTISK